MARVLLSRITCPSSFHFSLGIGSSPMLFSTAQGLIRWISIMFKMSMRVYSGSPALAGKELGLFREIYVEYCSIQWDDHAPVPHMVSGHFHS